MTCELGTTNIPSSQKGIKTEVRYLVPGCSDTASKVPSQQQMQTFLKETCLQPRQSLVRL